MKKKERKTSDSFGGTLRTAFVLLALCGISLAIVYAQDQRKAAAENDKTSVAPIETPAPAPTAPVTPKTETPPPDETKAESDAASDTETRRKLFEDLVDLYVYAFPAVLLDQTEKEMTESCFFAPVNQMAYLPQLPSPKLKISDCPNVDSLLATAWLDLTGEPQVLILPEKPLRFYMTEFLDAWSGVVGNLNAETAAEFPVYSLDGRSVRAVVFTGPQNAVAVPADLKTVASPTARLWLITRVMLGPPRSDKKLDRAGACRTLYEFEILPLSAFEKSAQKIGAVNKTSARTSVLSSFGFASAVPNRPIQERFVLLEEAELNDNSADETVHKTKEADHKTKKGDKEKSADEKKECEKTSDKPSDPKMIEKKPSNESAEMSENALAGESAEMSENALAVESAEMPENAPAVESAEMPENAPAVESAEMPENAPAGESAEMPENVPALIFETDTALVEEIAVTPQNGDAETVLKKLTEEEPKTEPVSAPQNETPTEKAVEKPSKKASEKPSKKASEKPSEPSEKTSEPSEKASEPSEPSEPKPTLSRKSYEWRRSMLGRPVLIQKTLLQASAAAPAAAAEPTEPAEKTPVAAPVPENAPSPKKQGDVKKAEERVRRDVENAERHLANDEKKIEKEEKRLENDVRRGEEKLEKDLRGDGEKIRKADDDLDRIAERIDRDLSEFFSHAYRHGKQWTREAVDSGRDAAAYFDHRAKRDFHRLAQEFAPMMGFDRKNILPLHRVCAMSGEEFFTRFTELLKTNPPVPADAAMAEKMKAVGMVPGETLVFEKMSPEIRHMIRFSVPYALMKIEQAALDGRFQTKQPGNWVVLKNLGHFETDYLCRAAVAEKFLGADSPNAILYPFTFQDAEGNRLTGEKKYRIHFPAGSAPPTDRLWSITLYDADYGLVPNRLDRYAIRSDLPLIYNEDGSFDLTVQREEPTENISNWLAAPEGEFMLMMRIYLPKSAALDGTWQAPPVVTEK